MTAIAWGAAFVAAFILAGIVAAAGPVDAPRDRGSHKRPTPTTGGLAILAATCLGTALASPPDGSTAAALACAGALGLYAALDDLRDLGAAPKLLAQILASAVFAGAVAAVTRLPLVDGFDLQLAWVVGAVGTALWLLVLGNAVNFMDGSDGLVAGSLVIAAAAVSALALIRSEPVIAAAAAALAAANLGFLPWNLGRRLFQGDVGALFSSFSLGALGVLLAARGGASPYLVPIATMPLLVDALGTLLLRIARREPVWRPHKQHLYQRWLTLEHGGHLTPAIRYWGAGAVCALIALSVELWAESWAFLATAGTCLALVLVWSAARRRLA